MESCPALALLTVWVDRLWIAVVWNPWLQGFIFHLEPGDHFLHWKPNCFAPISHSFPILFHRFGKYKEQFLLINIWMCYPKYVKSKNFYLSRVHFILGQEQLLKNWCETPQPHTKLKNQYSQSIFSTFQSYSCGKHFTNI